MKLDSFDNSWYNPGSLFKRVTWLVVSAVFFKSSFPVPSGIKSSILRMFGARVGENLTIKPCVNIKYPWFLTLGSNCWIGENVWIDNLAQVVLEDNVCLSQESYLLTGSHDYKRESFDLILGVITIKNGVWIGAKAIVCPGVTCQSYSILTVGSVATHDLHESGIYQGNPAALKRMRAVES